MKVGDTVDKSSISRMVEQKIEQAIRDFGMEQKLNGILIGYSGGADSGALLHYLYKYAKSHNIHIAAVHVHHGIRGEEADRDEEFCRAVCENLGITLYVERYDVPAMAKEQGKGLEEMARNVRYWTFHKLIDAHEELRHIALAHHAEDNMETVIFNMLRGAGTRGLAGIPPVRGERVIRPLIYCTRSEVIGYCIANDIDYVTDSTNENTDYTRNYIRQEILPRLSYINPSPEMAISQLCTLLRNDDVYIQGQAMKFIRENGIETSCDRKLLASQEPAISSRVIRHMYDRAAEAMYGWSRPYISLDFTHIRSVSRIIWWGGAHSRISLPQKICAAVEGDEFFFIGEEEYEGKYRYVPEFWIPLGEGLHDIPELQGAKLLISREPDTEFELKNKNIYKIFIHKEIASDKICGNLYIRNRTAGDKITHGGMSKLTKKLYCEYKIPLDVRNFLPVFCDCDGIVWIPYMDARDGVEIKEGDGHEKTLHIYFACSEKAPL